MKKGLKIVLIIVVSLVVIVSAGFMIKSDYKVERSIVVNASKDNIVNFIKDYEIRQSWSPWSKYDPDMKVTVEGNNGEVGAKYLWEGNDEVGKGYLELKSVSDSKVEEYLVFKEPFESEAPVWFTMKEVEGGVKVTWGMSGQTPILMTLFMDMEEMIGTEYEEGLSALKSRLE